MTGDVLLDGNVLVAVVVEAHQHHPPSVALLGRQDRIDFVAAGHSLAEVYNTLTREGPSAPFGYPPKTAWNAILQLRSRIAVLGLTPPQTVDAIGRYAHAGGIGPRRYDSLIGEVAVAHGISTLVTWNVIHMRGLFPALNVVTPVEFSAGLLAPGGGPV